MEDRERIFRECRYQVAATDMLAAALPALERANLDMPTFWMHWRNCIPPVRRSTSRTAASCFWLKMCAPTRSRDADRFIRFGVNVRFFNIQDTEDMDGEITVYDEDLIRSVIQYATVLSDTELRIHIKGGLEVTEQLPQYYTRRCRRK